MRPKRTAPGSRYDWGSLHRGIVPGMKPTQRRVLQAVLYELFAIGVVGPVLGWLFDEPMGSSLALAVVLSAMALTWNYVFNALFERC